MVIALHQNRRDAGSVETAPGWDVWYMTHVYSFRYTYAIYKKLKLILSNILNYIFKVTSLHLYD